MSDLVVALGLLFVIEGLLLAAFPDAMRRTWEAMMAMPDQFLRTAGLFAAVAGVFVVWLVRG